MPPLSREILWCSQRGSRRSFSPLQYGLSCYKSCFFSFFSVFPRSKRKSQSANILHPPSLPSLDTTPTWRMFSSCASHLLLYRDLMRRLLLLTLRRSYPSPDFLKRMPRPVPFRSHVFESILHLSFFNDRVCIRFRLRLILLHRVVVFSQVRLRRD